MEHIYLTRRNLKTLLSKLDRANRGETTARTIVKRDTDHPRFACSSAALITAVEDDEYYTDRVPGGILAEDFG